MGGVMAVPGLVSPSTSGTRESFEVNPLEGRLRRMRQSVLSAARFHQLEAPRSKVAMVTLTYRDVGGWAAGHITAFLRACRMWLARRGVRFRYVWVSELQSRGAVHYHVLVWLPRGLTLPKPDKQGWWCHGSSRVEWAKFAIGYVAKYASKIAQKSWSGWPPGLRMHGRGGFEALARSCARWYSLPGWARAVCDVAGAAVRAKGGGLVIRSTGVYLPSPWRVSLGGCRIVAEKVFEYLGGLRASGPFSWLPGRAPAWQ